MSDRVLRQPLSIRLLSTSTQPQKRKSNESEKENKEKENVEKENRENCSPNSAVKKLKESDDGAVIAADQKLKSGLPRYQRAPVKATPTNTPGKSKLRGNIQPGTPLSIAKRVGRLSICTPRPRRISHEKIGAYFDEGLTVNESKIADIMSVLKVKGKKQPFVDFKEKTKKYEAIIRELRDALRVVLSEIPILREKSVSHENYMTCLINEMDTNLFNTNEVREALELKENTLAEELKSVSEELKVTSLMAETLRKDHSPLRHKKEEMEALNIQLELDYANEVKFNQEGNNEIARLKAELTTAEDSLEIAEQRRSLEVMDLTASFSEKISKLESELGHRAADAERSGAEKAEIDRKAYGMKEELQVSQTRLHELETAAKQQDIDTCRLSSELERSKQQLEQKDADLRTMMASLAEDRVIARSDMSSLQSRITLLEQERVETASQLAGKREECLSSSRELSRIRDELSALESKQAAREADMQLGLDAIQQLEISNKLLSIMEVREESERRERVACSAQLLATQTQCSHQIRELEEKMAANTLKLNKEIVIITSLRDTAIEEVRAQSDLAMRLESEVQQLKRSLEDASISSEVIEELAKLTGECEVLKRRVREASENKQFEGSAAADRISELTERMRLGEIQRRKLHNLVQELRGNVRVFARVRPFLPSDGIDLSLESSPPTSISVRSDDVSLRISRTGAKAGAQTASGVERAEDHNFTFDRTFGPSSSQESVFQEVSEFVQSALDGYNVCLFSYGQTGSGKTHTMAGSGTGSMRGIIPRAIQQVGAYKTELESKGWVYQIEVSFIEIYNESIRDLLRSTSVEDVKHEIKRDAAGNMFVTEVTMTPVDPNNNQQMDGILELAARHRSVEKTAMNERSSRSHSVFTLHLCASNVSQGVLLKGTLSLVDLAGSERLDRSQAAGARMKETVAINKSLSSLVDVFAAIGNKQSHIPFRNSKLTYLLSPALSGDGKTLMMVNLSPTEESYFESLCSLRFASQVNQCELGKPKKQVKEGSLDSHSTGEGSEKEVAVPTTRLPASGIRKPRPTHA